MRKDPAYLFYSSDFLTGTTFLNWEERGKYITILCHIHQHGHLSEESIRFLVGSISDNLMAKFKKDENGLMYNERLEEEIQKRGYFTDSRKENGKLGGRPKKPSGKPSGKPTKNHMHNLPLNININEVIDYFKVNGYKEEVAIKAFNYYNDAGWIDSKGKPVKNWKQKMQGVWFKEENKIIQKSFSEKVKANGGVYN